MSRILAVLLLCAAASSLAAQATLAVTGTVTNVEERWHLFDINFGTGPTSVTFSATATGSSATLGLTAIVIDLDELVANGSGAGTGFDEDFNAGTGAVNPSITTGSYSGVHQFAVVFHANDMSTSGSVAYTGSVDVTTLAAGAITAVSTYVEDTSLTRPEVRRIFNRIVMGRGAVDPGQLLQHEFLVNMPSPAATMDTFFMAEGENTGNVSLIEVLANGTASNLSTLSDTGADWGGESNPVTTSRSGTVRFRVTSTTDGMDANWTLILPSTATTVANASITFAGTLAIDQTTMHRFTVDYGANSTSLVAHQTAASSTGTPDMMFLFLDELAANGSTNGFVTLTYEVTPCPTHSGVREFIFMVEAGGAPTTYSVTFDFAVAGSALVSTGTRTTSSPIAYSTIFDRGVEAEHEYTADETRTYDFLVNFGATTHTAEIYLYGEGTVDGDVRLIEVDGSATPPTLATATWTGANSDEVNITSPSRTGVVRFRIEVDGTNTETFNFAVIFDNTVTIGYVPGESDDDDEDDGCASRTGVSTGWLALLGLLGALAAAMRLRSVRE